MTGSEKSTQIRVGLFMFLGLLVLAAMVIYFGRIGEGFQGYYTLRVEFPNASGLFRGGDVMLAGARIGHVGTQPELLPSENGVFVNLKILNNVRIPSASEFSVGSSGLLGDKFVQIDLKEGAKDSPPVQPDTTIQGVSAGSGMSAMLAPLQPMIDKMSDAVDNIDQVVNKINKGVLTPDGMKHINQTLANLQTTTESLTEASKKVDGLVAQAQDAISSGKDTMVSAKQAADQMTKTLASINGLVTEAKTGKGLLGTLISNRETADNLKALVANLRRYGVLWYKDKDTDGSRPH